MPKLDGVRCRCTGWHNGHRTRSNKARCSPGITRRNHSSTACSCGDLRRSFRSKAGYGIADGPMTIETSGRAAKLGPLTVHETLTRRRPSTASLQAGPAPESPPHGRPIPDFVNAVRDALRDTTISPYAQPAVNTQIHHQPAQVSSSPAGLSTPSMLRNILQCWVTGSDFRGTTRCQWFHSAGGRHRKSCGPGHASSLPRVNLPHQFGEEFFPSRH